MSRFKVIFSTAVFALAPVVVMAQSVKTEDWGTPIALEDLADRYSYAPGANDLPAGSGTTIQGHEIYAEKCAACHGEQLEGIPAAGGPRLIGGRGTLTTEKPIKTVESYWPHAETFFDYVKRAMPFHEPGSLSDNEVYALTAYVLQQGGIIAEGAALDAKSLPQVKMPNADGFYRGDQYDLKLSWGWAD